MTDTFDPLGTFKSFFFANNKNVPQSTREKIALAMMLQKRKFPTTLGEGLGAIGESIGDIGAMRRLESEAGAAEDYASGVAGKLGGVPTPSIQRSSFAPTEDVPEEQTLRPPIAGAQPAQPAPSALTPPPQMPPALPAEPMPPDQQQSYEPGAPVRLTDPKRVQDWRNQNPVRGIPPVPPAALPAAPPPAPPPALPQGPPPPPSGPPPAALPPERPAQGFEDRFSPAGTGRRSALEAPPEALIGSAGADQLAPPANARDAIAAALMPKPGAPPPPDAFAQATPPPPVIPKAPSPQQLAQAAPQPMAEPGYISKLPPLRPPPPVMTDTMQAIQQEIQSAPPAYRESVQRKLAPIYEAEAAKVARQHEEYKDYRNHRQALELKIEDQKAKQRADQDAAAAAELAREKAKQEIKKGNVPVLQENVRAKSIWDDTKGAFVKAPIADAPKQKGPPEVVMNEGQASNLKFYNWTKEAEDTFEGKDKVLADGYGQRAIGQIPFVGNALQEKRYRNAAGAAERWVQGFMRDISGAAIGTAEFDKHMRTFFPAPGDSAKDIADKKRARETAAQGMYTSTGPGREVADYYDEERATTRAATQAAIEQKMQGVPREAGKISNNGKGDRMRWTGSRWEEP